MRYNLSLSAWVLNSRLGAAKRPWQAEDRPRAAYYDFSCLFPRCQLDRVAVKVRQTHNWSCCDGRADFSRIFAVHCFVPLLYLPIKFKELLKFQFIKSCNNLTLNLFIFPRGSDSAHKSKPCRECGFRILSCYNFVGIIMLMTGNFPLHVTHCHSPWMDEILHFNTPVNIYAVLFIKVLNKVWHQACQYPTKNRTFNTHITLDTFSASTYHSEVIINCTVYTVCL